MKRLFVIVTVALLVLACKSVISVSGGQLMAATKRWKEPKVAIWYYTGSSDRHDYFLNRDLGIEQAYRVPIGEIQLTQRFPPTGERGTWVVMPWGPLALKRSP